MANTSWTCAGQSGFLVTLAPFVYILFCILLYVILLFVQQVKWVWFCQLICHCKLFIFLDQNSPIFQIVGLGQEAFIDRWGLCSLILILIKNVCTVLTAVIFRAALCILFRHLWNALKKNSSSFLRQIVTTLSFCSRLTLCH